MRRGRERERERERESDKEYVQEHQSIFYANLRACEPEMKVSMRCLSEKCEWKRESACVCLRERERERGMK